MRRFILIHGPAVLFFLGVGCWASDVTADGLRSRCESILKQSLAGDELLNRAAPSLPLLAAIYGLKDWPIELVEQRLLSLLEDDDFVVRLQAAEVLVQQTGTMHRKRILASVEAPDENPMRLVRVDALYARLGDRDAHRRLRHWARLDRERDQNAWICSMHPEVRKPAEGTCPICSMDLAQLRGYYSPTDRLAQTYALDVLAEWSDPEVPEIARRILTDDTRASWRNSAAEAWFRVDPDRALPHLVIFLEAPRRGIRLSTIGSLARMHPEKCIAQLKQLHDSSPRTSHDRLYAAKGLVSARQTEYLETIRELAKCDVAGVRVEAFQTLGKVGTLHDADLLKEYLDTDERVMAAIAILHILKRTESSALN